MPGVDAGLRPAVVSAAAGRMRVHAVGFRHDYLRASAIEETVAKVTGVRAVQAYPRTASVVVWYAPGACDTAAVLAAICSVESVGAAPTGERTSRSSVARGRSSVLNNVIGRLARTLSKPRGGLSSDPPEIQRLRAALDRLGYHLEPAPAGQHSPIRLIKRGRVRVRAQWVSLTLPLGLIALGLTGVGVCWLLRRAANMGFPAARPARARMIRHSPRSPLAAMATAAPAVPSWGGVGVSLLLVTAAGAVTYRQRLGLTKELVVAAARAAVQLVTAGALLRVLFQWTSLLGAAGWVSMMTIVAGQVAGRRGAGIPQARLIATGGVAASTGVTLGALLAGRVIAAETRVLVPVSGMIVSSAMLAAGSTLRRLDYEVRQSRPAIEARLSLGQSGRQAILPHRRSALRTALIPTIDSTKVVGLISLPGAMTGLILAGTSPLTAIRYQIVVMYMQLAATALSALVTVRLAEKSLFDDAQRLNQANLPGNTS
nr:MULTISPECIES: iron export ABC transporter permease subunit FetB [Mycobacterium]